MLGHLRANVLLVGLTLGVCSVAYPLFLLAVGQAIFPDSSQGSLIAGPDGKPIGSRLVAQPFTGDEYFQPRPSAVGYNAAATGGSNLGPSNPALRARVQGMLGSILKYGPAGPKPGKRIGPDIEAFLKKDQFQGTPGIVAIWARQNPDAADAWVKSVGDALKEHWKTDDSNEAFSLQWAEDFPQQHKRWIDAGKPDPLVRGFFESFSKAFPGEWPTLEDRQTMAKESRKALTRVRESAEIQNVFYPMWRQENPNVDLAPAPADMVMASGSGIDPHITLQNALYQMDRVADAWAAKSKGEAAKVKSEIEGLLRAHARAPLYGLAGVELVNVLEVNVAIRKKLSPN